VATELLKQTFPNGDVIIIPQTGNHEAYPVNVFDYKTDREVGFRQIIADLWRDWIGDQAAESL
jgi:sphingomyelin phosphodiesterase